MDLWFLKGDITMAKYTNALRKITTDPIIHVDGSPTNYRPDAHKYFCERCYKRNGGICPDTGRKGKKQFCTA